MKKYIKYVIIMCILLFFSIFAIPSFGTTETIEEYKINSYNVKINVNEDNTFDVEETITVNYPNETYGGITITLVKDLELMKYDGSKIDKFARVTNVQTNEKCSVDNSFEKLILKFGDNTESVVGNKTYVIKYTCDIGKDPFAENDEFYFNIFNNHTDVKIHNASFEIIMPKSFDKNDMNIYSSINGNVNNENIVYNVDDGKVIKGYYNGNLESGEIVTLNINLPDGYFVINNKAEMIISISLISFSVLGIILCYLLWRKYGNDDPIVKISCSKPPKGCTSAELGFFYKGESTSNDIMTILLELANKGYIKVQETFETSLFVKNRSYNIIKLKDYDGKNEYEKMFFEEIFKTKTEVSEQELNKSLNVILKKVEKKIESKKNIKKVFEDTGELKGKLVLFIGLLVLIFTLVIPMYKLYDSYGIFISIPLIIFEYLGYISIKAIPEYDFSKKRSLIFAIILFMEFIFFMTVPVAVVTRLFYFELSYNVTYFVGLVSFAVILFIRHYMSKRTKFGTEILGEILGFEEYLVSVTVEELKDELNENPLYYYEILPYAYVLGIADEWIKKFENTKINIPKWYETEDIDFKTLNIVIQNLIIVDKK